jgi:hypothetical protein
MTVLDEVPGERFSENALKSLSLAAFYPKEDNFMFTICRVGRVALCKAWLLWADFSR